MNTINLNDEGLTDGDTIDPHLQDHVRDGMEVVIPDGSYEWAGDWLGGQYSDVVIRAPNRVELQAGDGHDYDLTLVADGGDVLVENLSIRGQADGKNAVRCGAQGEYQLTLKSFYQPDGSKDTGSGRQGIFVPQGVSGTVRLEDCLVRGFEDNGVYGSPPGHGAGGTVEVIGGRYEYNGVSNVRIGSDGSVIRGVEIRSDGSTHNPQRGIYLRQEATVTVENTDIRMDSGVGAIVCYGNGRHYDGTFKDNRIRTNGGAAFHVGNNGSTDFDSSGNHHTGSGPTAHPDEYADYFECVGKNCDAPTFSFTPGEAASPTPPEDLTQLRSRVETLEAQLVDQDRRLSKLEDLVDSVRGYFEK